MIKVTLGGVPLNLLSGQVWTLQYGTTPYERTFVSTRERIEAIMAKEGPLTLVVESAGYPTLTVQGLYALRINPVDSENLGVVVADRRWMWSRKTITRDYNVRRRTGDRRRVGNQLQEIQIKDLVADVVYRRSSLNEGTKWTAAQILEDVLEELAGEGNFDIGATQFDIDVEGLILDRDRGDTALQRVLNFIPGARCYVDTDGRVKITDMFDGSEAKVVQRLGGRYWNLPGQLELIDHSKIRPQTVHIQFEVEPELRFDYNEDAWNPTLDPGKEGRLLHNVIPIADASIGPYASAILGRNITLTEGTWVPLQLWLEAVNWAAGNAAAGAAGRFPNGDASFALSMPVLRSQVLSGFQHVRNKLSLFQVGIADVVWDKRIAVLDAHFRRTFRILPQWMDKLRSIKAVRASILDQETGRRGKAEVFTDYFVKPSRRSLAKKLGDGLPQLGHNIPGYAADLTGARSAPCDVIIIDDQAGIFTLAWRTDPWGDAAKIVPGELDTKAAAALQVAKADPLILDSAEVTLEAGWNLAVVLTALVASPNDSRRMYTRSVDLAKAFEQLPGKPVPAAAKAPDWTIGLGAGIETARFMWSDAAPLPGDVQNAIFGTVDQNHHGELPPDNWESLREPLLTNKATTDALAEAMAARVQSILIDRWEGDAIYALDPTVKPTGSLAAVSHAILGSGTAITKIALPPVLHAPDIYSMLPDGARRILQRQVQE